MKTVKQLRIIFSIGMIIIFMPFKINSQENKLNANPFSENLNYINAVGLRLGGTSGITYNHKFKEKNSIKFIMGMFPSSYGLTILYERFIPTKAKGLNLYFGAGGHVSGAYYSTWYYYNMNINRYSYIRTYGYSPIIGFDIIGGIEYKIPKIPLALSFDLKPFIEFFNGYGPFFNPDPSIGAKFTF
jgi:hypothetical protein